MWLYCCVVVMTIPVVVAQVPVFRSEVRIVEVPVVVLDKKSGRAVRDLVKDDFRLFEAGKRHPIELFTVYSAAPDDTARTNHVPQMPAGLAERSNRPQFSSEPVPMVTLLIDGYNARYEEQYYAAKAAADVLGQSAHRAQWAVYFLGQQGLRVLHDYTEDSASVSRELRKLRTVGDPTRGLSTESYLNGIPDVASALSVLPQSGGLDQTRMRVYTTLVALRDIGRHLRGVPGRKSVIWLTAGISMRAILGTFPDLWKDALNALNDANVAVYPVDSAGVRTTSGYLAERPTRSLTLRPSMGGTYQMTDVMLGIAENTGGRAFLNTNDLAGSVSRALGDSQTYYRLAYRPTHARWDGRYFPIRVKIPNRRGIEIRHRLGYFARTENSLPQEGIDRLLAGAVASPLDAVDIGLTIKVAACAGSSHISILLTAEPDSVSMEPRQDRFHGRFYVRCVQYAIDGRSLKDFTDEVNLSLDKVDARRTVDEGFHYKREIELLPNVRKLKLVFCDHASGRLGSVSLDLPSGW